MGPTDHHRSQNIAAAALMTILMTIAIRRAAMRMRKACEDISRDISPTSHPARK